MVHTALVPTSCRHYLSELPHTLQLCWFFPTSETVISPLLYFYKFPTGLLASRDALWVILHTIAKGIIPRCKSDHVMSLLKTLQWLLVVECKHLCSTHWTLAIWPLVLILISPSDAYPMPLCSSHSELSLQILDSLIYLHVCACYPLPEMLSFHIFPNSFSSFRSSSHAIIP